MENEDIIQSPDDSMVQSVEETQPYLSQQNFLEFEDIKGVIKSFLNLYPLSIFFLNATFKTSSNGFIISLT
jgi:hypothetical protein